MTKMFFAECPECGHSGNHPVAHENPTTVECTECHIEFEPDPATQID